MSKETVAKELCKSYTAFITKIREAQALDIEVGLEAGYSYPFPFKNDREVWLTYRHYVNYVNYGYMATFICKEEFEPIIPERLNSLLADLGIPESLPYKETCEQLKRFIKRNVEQRNPTIPLGH